MPKRRWIIAFSAAVLVGVSAGALALAAPSVAAAACPQCYGLTDLGQGVYAERDDDTYLAMIDKAEQRVERFYGGRQADARVLICATDTCYRRIGGGGEKGKALRDRALLLSPAGATETIAAHELAHLELHARLGDARGKVPHWLDEGLAVVVSDDPRYLKTEDDPQAVKAADDPGAPKAADDPGAVKTEDDPGAVKTGTDRCLVDYEEALAVTRGDWPTASDDGYLLAGCVVSRWVAAHDVHQWVSDLRGGMIFQEAWS